MNSIAYVNGSYIALSQAKVSVLDRGFLFADAIYEVSAVLEGKLVDNQSHLARLERSVAEIGLELPTSLEKIQDIQCELVQRNKIDSGLIYMQLTRGADMSGRDFAFPPKHVKPTLVMFAIELDLLELPSVKAGISVISTPDLRWARRDIKSVGLLAQVLARESARRAGAGEAWMVQDGFVTEGAASTAFIVTKDNVIVTRQNSNSILPGCTRKAVQRLVEERQMRFEERSFSIVEAQAAKEAFITNAACFVQPVISIDDKKIGDGKPGETAKYLREIYIQFARQTADR